MFSFELTAADMSALAALDGGEANAVDSDKFGH